MRSLSFKIYGVNDTQFLFSYKFYINDICPYATFFNKIYLQQSVQFDQILFWGCNNATMTYVKNKEKVTKYYVGNVLTFLAKDLVYKSKLILQKCPQKTPTSKY